MRGFFPRTHFWEIPGSTGHSNESQNHAKHIDLLNTRGGFQDAWGIIMNIKIVQKMTICSKPEGGEAHGIIMNLKVLQKTSKLALVKLSAAR